MTNIEQSTHIALQSIPKILRGIAELIANKKDKIEVTDTNGDTFIIPRPSILYIYRPADHTFIALTLNNGKSIMVDDKQYETLKQEL